MRDGLIIMKEAEEERGMFIMRVLRLAHETGRHVRSGQKGEHNNRLAHLVKQLLERKQKVLLLWGSLF